MRSLQGVSRLFSERAECSINICWHSQFDGLYCPIHTTEYAPHVVKHGRVGGIGGIVHHRNFFCVRQDRSDHLHQFCGDALG